MLPVTIRRVVIVKDGYPTGIISRGTLLRWYQNWLLLHGRMPSDGAAHALGEGDSYRQRLTKGALAISEHAQALQQQMRTPVSDLMPLVIDRASCMQELINDLLADSRSLLHPSDQVR